MVKTKLPLLGTLYLELPLTSKNDVARDTFRTLPAYIIKLLYNDYKNIFEITPI